ncbi:MAG: tetratricopeptide repeat protein [Bacteroidota bacterium]
MKPLYDRINSKGASVYFIVILFISLSVYFSVSNNEFLINWDDGSQVVNNPDINNISFTEIKKIFSSYYVGMYQPLTTISYAIDYALFGLSAEAFHLSQLLYHFFVIILVYTLLIRTTKNYFLSFILSLIFAVHPLNVESVAWISARSNILYTIFYILAILSYLKYLKQEKKVRYYMLTIIFFVLSCLSKSAAITLPVLLIVIDYFYSKINWKNLINKLPFFLISVVFGLITIDARTKASHIVDLNEHYTHIQLILITVFSVFRYVQLFVFHTNYSAFYTYPEKINDLLPAEFYYVPIIFILIVIILSWILFKKNKPVLFGLLFFLVSLSVMLKIVPAGMQYMADRYMYLPMIGLFICLGQIKSEYFRKHLIILIGSFFIYILFLSYKTLLYNEYWKNESQLYEQTLKTQPNAVPVKNFLGIIHKKNGNTKEALFYFDDIINKYPAYGSVYNNRGNLYKDLGNFDMAMQDYNMAILYEGEQPEIFTNIGILYAMSEDNEMAISYFTKAIKMDSEFYLAFFNRGKMFAMNGYFDKALNDLNKAILINPEFSMAYYTRGMVFYSLGNSEDACKDLKMAEKLGNKQAKAQIIGICN